MNNFIVLFNFNIKRRLKDSFIIGYSVIFPIMLIGILGYITTKLFDNRIGISSFNYYALVIIPLTTFMGIITMMYVAREERNFKVSFRFISAPLRKTEILLSKIISGAVSMSLWNVIVLFIVKFLFNMQFKGKLFNVALLLASESFMSVAIGIFTGLCFKNFNTIKNIINIPICLFGMLGGAFFPVGSLGKTFETISYISPLMWINKGLVSMIYDNDYSFYFMSIIITLAVALIFTLFSIKFFKKEAFL